MEVMFVLVKILVNQTIEHIGQCIPKWKLKSNIIHNQFTLAWRWGKKQGESFSESRTWVEQRGRTGTI
jgi:hypothetical protein